MPPAAGVQSVWYIGASDVRSITAAQWAAAGFAGVVDTVWSAANGWSLDAHNFTDAQLTFLGSLSEFNAAGVPFGPRPGSSSTVVNTPDTTPATKGYVASTAVLLPAIAGAAGDNYSLDDLGKTILHSQEVCASIDDTGNTLTAVATTAYPLGVPSVVVFPSKSPITLEWGGQFQITTAGDGNIGFNVYETTSGTAVAVGPSVGTSGGFKLGTFSKFVDIPLGRYRLGPVATTRIFKLGAFVFADGSPVLAASVKGGNANTKPFLRAVRS